RGNALRDAIATFEATGRATVIAEDIHDDDSRGRTVRETITIDQTVGNGDEAKPVRTWIANCHTGPCALDGTYDFPLHIRRYETRSAKPVIGGVIGSIVVGGLVGSVVCGLACAEGSDA